MHAALALAIHHDDPQSVYMLYNPINGIMRRWGVSSNDIDDVTDTHTPVKSSCKHPCPIMHDTIITYDA